MVKRAIRDSLVAEEEVQCDGGDNAVTEMESCLTPLSEMSTDMSCLCIILNVFLAPLGTFVASGLDKRGCNVKLLVVGILNVLPVIIMSILLAQAMKKFGDAAINATKDSYNQKTATDDLKDIAEEAHNLIIGVIVLSIIQFFLWIHGLIITCKIKAANSVGK